MLLDPREIPIVPFARAFVLAVGQNKVISTFQKGRIESRSDATWVRAQSLTNHYRSALARGRDRALETKPLMISICIRPFRSFRGGGEGGGGGEGPRVPGPSLQ